MQGEPAAEVTDGGEYDVFTYEFEADGRTDRRITVAVEDNVAVAGV